jgi:hypothetical protein
MSTSCGGETAVVTITFSGLMSRWHTPSSRMRTSARSELLRHAPRRVTPEAAHGWRLRRAEARAPDEEGVQDDVRHRLSVLDVLVKGVALRAGSGAMTARRPAAVLMR